LSDRETARITSRILADVSGGTSGSADRIEQRIESVMPFLGSKVAKEIADLATGTALLRKTSTTSSPTTIEEAMRGTDPRSGFSRSDIDLLERRGGELLLSPISTLIDEAKQTGALTRGTASSYALTTAGFLLDFITCTDYE
jgi:hypothetical protein